MLLEDRAIWNCARALVNDEIDAPQLVRNSFFPMAHQWLRLIETWAGGAIASQPRPLPVRDGSAGGHSRAVAERRSAQP